MEIRILTHIERLPTYIHTVHTYICRDLKQNTESSRSIRVGEELELLSYLVSPRKKKKGTFGEQTLDNRVFFSPLHALPHRR